MDSSYLKSPYSKRYVIEDSVPKATSDGEPHEVMTLVAGLSGMLAAFVILGILITLIGCRRKERQRPKNPPPPTPEASEISEISNKRSSMLPLFTKSISMMEETNPRLVSVSVISNNLGNLNQAFVASEMCLGPKDEKHKMSIQHL
ncbi:uncharacterized protein LOC129910674 [Episyrphus balteatus]|uniref:uncharacterized protein LOC129910674 n=1 Tax=Episyrphus balteatus TaxID=286459 RepID=UPI0024867D69|nr:uncharacterized protein LOC129910674 [Episyrphus balteatus]XP_055844119.1 uncharacterized protein LOC129910674 [Episyrphus balteatus]